jgi:hypothetical protein
MHTRCVTCSYWALGRQLTDTLVERRSLAPSPPWARREAKEEIGRQGWRRCDSGQSPAWHRLTGSTGLPLRTSKRWCR